MNNLKIVICFIILLSSCKSTEKCDAYGSTIIFPPMHVHNWSGNSWSCYEFPADTLELNKNVYTIK